MSSAQKPESMQANREDPVLPFEAQHSTAPWSTDTLSDTLHQAESALSAAATLIHRSYLGNLKSFPVQPASTSDRVDTAQSVRIFRLGRLVAESRHSILESLTATYTALGATGHAVFLLIDSDGEHTDLYIGCRASRKGNGHAAGRLLEESFNGHFPGSHLEPLKNSQTQKLLEQISQSEASKTTAVTAVTSVPSLKIDEQEHFSQGLERFLDAAENRSYTALILADPLSPAQLNCLRAGYEAAATQIAPLLKTQLSYGNQESEAVGLSLTTGISASLGKSLSLTETTGTAESTSSTTGESVTVTKDPSLLLGALGMAAGAVMFAGGPLSLVALGILGSAGSGLSAATLGSKASGTSTSKSSSQSFSNSQSRSETETSTSTDSQSTARSDTMTTGNSRQLTLDLPNKSVEQLLKKIDSHLKRSDEARAYGGWQTAAYFIGDTTESSVSLGSMFLGLTRGRDSGTEDFALTTWNSQENSARNEVLTWLANLAHPRLKADFASTLGVDHVTPATLLSGREMALQLGVPRRSAAAVTVLEVPTYGRNIRLLNLDSNSDRTGNAEGLRLGKLRHLWRDTEIELSLELDKLCYHTLITGTTGVGKTTLIMSLLTQSHSKGIPFLAIEPAKGEYRQLLGLGVPGKPVTYRVAGRSGTDALRINPLVFPEGIQLTDHIDRISAVFNAAFPMYAAMPQILEEAFYMAYEELGWDSQTSTCLGVSRQFPTLRRVADLIPNVVRQLGYSTDLSSDYVGALSARLRSLCRGSLGLTLLCSAHEETSDSELFEHSAVVDLSPMGSPEKRALLMGLLFMRLYERRIAQGLPDNSTLRHLMVLEEAHVLLKRSSTEQSQDASNPRGHAVESFANALAEMRAFGQGFVVADQSASVLDDCVLRNTSTKIVMRAPFEEDRLALGGALALDEKQTQQLAKLENQTAVVHQSHWLEPVLCHIERVELPALPVCANAEQRRELQRQARTRVVMRLWGDRNPAPSVPRIDTELDADFQALDISTPVAQWIKAACQKEAARDLNTFGECLLTLLPQLHDTAFREMAISLQAQWNRVHALLTHELDIQNTKASLALACDIIKFMNRDKLDLRHLHQELDKFMRNL